MSTSLPPTLSAYICVVLNEEASRMGYGASEVRGILLRDDTTIRRASRATRYHVKGVAVVEETQRTPTTEATPTRGLQSILHDEATLDAPVDVEHARRVHEIGAQSKHFLVRHAQD